MIPNSSTWRGPGFRQPHDHGVHSRYETHRRQARAVLRGPPQLVDVIPNPIFHKLSLSVPYIRLHMREYRSSTPQFTKELGLLQSSDATSEYTRLFAYGSIEPYSLYLPVYSEVCRRPGGLLLSGGLFSMVSAQQETATSYPWTNPSVGTTAAQRLSWDLI